MSFSSRIRTSARLVSLTSREIDSSFSGVPSGPAIGVTMTSHQRGLPFRVLANPWNRPVPPLAASATAASTLACSSPCQKSGQQAPRIWPKSSASMTHMPPSFINSTWPPRSSTLMQSAELARIRLVNSSLSRSRASTVRRSVSSRAILMKPVMAPAASCSGRTEPLAKNRVPSRRMCQRSSAAQPRVRATPSSRAGTPAAWSSGVNRTAADRPTMSEAGQPKIACRPWCPVENDAVQIGDEDRMVLHALDQAAVAFLALAQCGGGGSFTADHRMLVAGELVLRHDRAAEANQLGHFLDLMDDQGDRAGLVQHRRVDRAPPALDETPRRIAYRIALRRHHIGDSRSRPPVPAMPTGCGRRRRRDRPDRPGTGRTAVRRSARPRSCR